MAPFVSDTYAMRCFVRRLRCLAEMRVESTGLAHAIGSRSDVAQRVVDETHRAFMAADRDKCALLCVASCVLRCLAPRVTHSTTRLLPFAWCARSGVCAVLLCSVKCLRPDSCARAPRRDPRGLLPRVGVRLIAQQPDDRFGV